MEQNKPDGFFRGSETRYYAMHGARTRNDMVSGSGSFAVDLADHQYQEKWFSGAKYTPDGMWKHPNTHNSNPLVGGPLIDNQKCGYCAIYLMTIPQLWYIGAYLGNTR